MLQNAYFLARIGADTAENEEHYFTENLPKIGNYPPTTPTTPSRAAPPRAVGGIGKDARYVNRMTFLSAFIFPRANNSGSPEMLSKISSMSTLFQIISAITRKRAKFRERVIKLDNICGEET